MILARLTAAIRAQNWFAVVLEFVIVVLGVMLAFQLTSLSARHQARADEAATLARLFEETVEAIDYVDRAIERGLANLARLDRSVSALALGDLGTMSPDEFEAGIWASTTYPALTPPRAVQDELIASGRIGSLGAVDVRSALARYHRRLEYFEQQLPYFRSVSLVQPDEVSDGAFRVEYRPDAPDRTETVSDFDALVGNEAFLRSVIRDLYGLEAMLRYRAAAREAAYALCLALAAELDRPCPAEPYELVTFPDPPANSEATP